VSCCFPRRFSIASLLLPASSLVLCFSSTALATNICSASPFRAILGHRHPTPRPIRRVQERTINRSKKLLRESTRKLRFLCSPCLNLYSSAVLRSSRRHAGYIATQTDHSVCAGSTSLFEITKTSKFAFYQFEMESLSFAAKSSGNPLSVFCTLVALHRRTASNTVLLSAASESFRFFQVHLGKLGERSRLVQTCIV